MKKLLFVFAIAAFASCNNAAETETLSADTTITTEISVDTTVATTVDTTVAAPTQ